jgi:hypothetical protein
LVISFFQFLTQKHFLVLCLHLTPPSTSTSSLLAKLGIHFGIIVLVHFGVGVLQLLGPVILLLFSPGILLLLGMSVLLLPGVDVRLFHGSSQPPAAPTHF